MPFLQGQSEESELRGPVDVDGEIRYGQSPNGGEGE